MPIRKFRKRRFRRKRRMPLRRLIKKVIVQQAEKKFHNLLVTNTDLTTSTSTTNSLSQVPEGTGVGQHIGDNIDVTRLRFRFQIRVITGAQSPNAVRVMLFQELSNQPVVSLPVRMEDLWPTLNISLNPYRVLYDRTFDMGLGIHSDVVVDTTIKRMQKQITFSTGLTNTMGEIFVRVITDNTVADALEFFSSSRLYFTDQ